MNINVSEHIDELLPLAVEYGSNILLAIIWLLVGWQIIKRITKSLHKPLELAITDLSVRNFLISFISMFLKVVLFISVASLLGLETTSLIAALGAVGVAIGLALQGSLSNFAGGLLLLIFKPFRVGDYIQTQGEEGTVASITILYTILDTTQNQQITIPNGKLANDVIKNFSVHDIRMIQYKIGISYDADIQVAKERIEVVLQQEKNLLDDKKIVIGVHELGDHAVIILARAWVPSKEYLKTSHRLLENLKMDLEKHDIGLQYPQFMTHTGATNS